LAGYLNIMYVCSIVQMFSFIHLVVCLMTGPKPIPERALHIVRYHLFTGSVLVYYNFFHIRRILGCIYIVVDVTWFLCIAIITGALVAYV